MTSNSNPLPYTDTKPVGAADFYFAINATFRFILTRLGLEGLRRYWADMGASYYRPVTERWRQGGLPGVAEYWRAFFQAEPDAAVEVGQSIDAVTLDVKVCPAIKHLRENGRQIVACFCQHCYYVSEAIAAPAGLTVRISGGNGSCLQRFMKHEAGAEPQRIEDIQEAL
jgi:hypothetical protein